MKTTLRGLALAVVVAGAGFTLIRPAPPFRRIFQSPGAQSAEKATPGFTVRGLVLHEGSAVAGARVRLVPLKTARGGVLVTTPLSRQAVTDSDGRFELLDVPQGPGRLVVIADRLAPSFTTMEIPASDVTIPLEAGATMEGRVGAIAGAQVSVFLLGKESLLDRRPLREGITDAEGRYRMEGLDPARPIRLVILAEGYRPFEKSLRSSAEWPSETNLDPGIQISGRLVTASGEPVADAKVEASQGEGYISGTRSLATGEVRLGGLIARPLSIHVLLDGFAPARLDLAGPSNGWTITLRRNGGLAGQAPAGSWLVIETASATFRRGLGADGSFRWEGLPPGPAEARATDRSGRLLASRKVEIPEGEVAGGILLAP